MLDELISQVRAGRALTREESVAGFGELMSGRLSDPQIEALLVALADKGETVDEIVGAATALREHAIRVACHDPDAIDTCGTGGDGISTFNVSTAAAIVAAAAGATVAKHGNRSNTRRSGSAEVLQELGVNVDAAPAVVERCLREVGIGFLHAARLHPAMRHAAAVRRRLARRTIFNLIGPLANPAGVRRQVVGVPRRDLLETMVAALRDLGAVHALVVHGHDGLCDLTITGPSTCLELRDGCINRRVISPKDVGLAEGSLESLRIESPAASARVIRAVLSGEAGAPRDQTLMNASGALLVAGIATDLAAGVQLAAQAVDSGEALRRLQQWTEVSQARD